MTALVVCRDSHVNKLGRRISVAERNDGDVDVGGFFDGLSVGARIGDNDQARFFERACDIVGEVSRGETTCDGNSASVSGEFEYCTLAIRAGGDYSDVGRIIDGGDDAGCKDNLLPRKSRRSAT